MLRFTQGNLLDARSEAIVNAVNTVGVMGKGIALQFKRRFPENFAAYAAACHAGEVRIGQMFVTSRNAPTGPRWIINFPTKMHWKNPTKLEWVRAGLGALRQLIVAERMRSIALPALGCGLGGLDWNVVRSQIESALGDLTEVEVAVYEPLPHPTVAPRG